MSSSERSGDRPKSNYGLLRLIRRFLFLVLNKTYFDNTMSNVKTIHVLWNIHCPLCTYKFAFLLEHIFFQNNSSLLGYPILVTNGTYAVNASDNVTLTCDFSSTYPAVLAMRWYKYDKEINDSIQVRYVGGTLNNPALTITDFQQEDQGVYRCSASNQYGTRTSSDITVYIHKGILASATKILHVRAYPNSLN